MVKCISECKVIEGSVLCSQTAKNTSCKFLSQVSSKVAKPTDWRSNTIIHAISFFQRKKQTEYLFRSHSNSENLNQLKLPKSQSYFSQRSKYFRSNYLFYSFTLDEVKHDLLCNTGQGFYSSQFDKIAIINKQKHLVRQRPLLKLHDCCNCTNEELQKLDLKARRSIMICSSLIYISGKLINYLLKNLIMRSSCRLMYKIVNRATNSERSQLTSIIQARLLDLQRSDL